MPEETPTDPVEDPIEPTAPQDEPAADPQPEPQPDAKDAARIAYEARKATKEAEALRKELEGYKRRDEEKRRSEMTEKQRLQEERDNLANEVERLRIDGLRNKVAAEMKLPAALAARLIGTDEESLRADAEDLLKLLPKPKVGNPTDPARTSGTARIYKRSELARDPKLAASPEVAQAAREGRVIDG